MQRFKLALITAGAALVLAACGGAADSGPVETQQQREDRLASSSLEGLINFMRGLVSAPNDQAQPRPIDGITPPTSDTAEPASL